LRLPGKERGPENRRGRPSDTLQIPKRCHQRWAAFRLGWAARTFRASGLTWQIRKAPLIEHGRWLHLIATWWKTRKGRDKLAGKSWHTRHDTRVCRLGLILRKGR
jgi:hypothetical protein